jgi:hypothetical protein
MALGREALQELELRVIRDDHFEFGFTVYDRVEAGTPGAVNIGTDSTGATIWGTPKDLTDFVPRAQIRSSIDASSVLESFTISRNSDGTGALDDTGIVWLTLTPSDTLNLQDGAVSDFELTAPVAQGGKRRTYFKIKIILEKDVSRD